MPDLSESLAGRDLGHLQIIAELWGIELEAPDRSTALPRLVAALRDPTLLAEVVGELPPAALAALEDLAQHNGRLPWTQFTRRHGELREMGAARRDRQRPHLKPASPVESLWYRALLARAFFDTPGGPEEFAYIPDDLLARLPASAGEARVSLGRPATPDERAHAILADDRILDHTCTYLAALRLGLPINDIEALTASWYPASQSLSPAPLNALLSAAGMLDESGLPRPEETRAFLEAGRGEALGTLARAWRHSASFNELRLVPHLSAEGEWQNDPLRARQAVLDFLEPLPANTWWCLPAFLADVRQHHPDFQRPAGDYDSWFIRDLRTGEFLRGFEHWDEVEGALIRYILTGPLHWLGVLDLASPGAGRPVTAFRFSRWSAALLHDLAPVDLPAEDAPVFARSDARLRLPRHAPRSVRYQVARFCEWEKEKLDEYHYRITPSALKRARQQGLKVGHLLTLLRRHAEAVPPSLVTALERWEGQGSAARLERLLVLRLSSPEMLQRLRASRAARFLGDPLGPTAIVVKPSAWEKVLAVLAELGYLGEADIDNEE